MTQTYHLESEPEVPDCAAPRPGDPTDVCGYAAGHAGDHADLNSGATWSQHHVLRLNSSDADRLPRLAQLVALYDAAKDAADDAAEALKAITDGIKAETSSAVPGGTDFTIVSGDLALPLTLKLVRSERVDTKLLRAMLGDRYSSVCKPSQAWTLKRKG